MDTDKIFEKPFMPLRGLTYHYPGAVVSEIDRELLENTKVTLINLPIREQVSPNNPPLGLVHLGARLQEFGVDVSIVDLNIYRINDAVSKKRNLPKL